MIFCIINLVADYLIFKIIVVIRRRESNTFTFSHSMSHNQSSINFVLLNLNDMIQHITVESESHLTESKPHVNPGFTL